MTQNKFNNIIKYLNKKIKIFKKGIKVIKNYKSIKEK